MFVIEQLLLSPFSTKNKMSDDVRSNAVYDFLCAGFNTSYVSETYRYNSARTHKHLKTDKKSKIYQHFRQIAQYKSVCKETWKTQIHPQTAGRYVHKLVQALSKQAGKICFGVDSSIKVWFSILVCPQVFAIKIFVYFVMHNILQVFFYWYLDTVVKLVLAFNYNTFPMHCKLLSPTSYTLYCFCDFKELVT